MRDETVEPATGPSLDAETQRHLLAHARVAADRAYVPYSDFPVGAAVLAADGSIHIGCNVENASYGLTICAERAAVSAAVGAGHRQILAVAVSTPLASGTSPCGACRQVLNEFRPATTDMVVVLDDHDSGDTVWLAELLPRAFGPRDHHTASLADEADSKKLRAEHGG